MATHRSTIGDRKGQTLIIAIMVMFILAIIATIFILMIARNLQRSSRMSSTDAVAAIAEAGIRYADEMLTTSEDGADWRPVPDNLTVAGSDQDFQWLRPYSAVEAPDGSTGPSGGFTRFNSGQGRFLLRVSYNPNPNITMSKYIKIESIGRWGTIDPNDPTTMRDASSYRLRREITAFKPIGITDSLRFITNKDSRSADIPLGVPGYRTNFGRSASATKYGERGGPVRVNGNVLLHGISGGSSSINFYLRGVVANDLAQSASDLLPIEGVECSGDISFDEGVSAQLHQINGGTVTDFDLLPSDDPNFITAGGFFRDGRNTTDKDLRPRGVKRIEPPLVDQTDPTNTTLRYRVLTLNSGERVLVQRGTSQQWVNLGGLGWGKGVYINNTGDKQDNSDTLGGSFSLRADWTQPNNMMSTSWKGPYYVPPAVVITLVPDDYEDINGKRQYYFTMTRTDTIASGALFGQKQVWSDPDGYGRPDWGQTIRMPYPDSENGRTLFTASGQKHIEGNGVIYAEGNIRIRGMLPPGMKLTIVSNQNIYIDGNVLKYRDPKQVKLDAGGNYHSADPTCGLALLARQNVVVNTTQFFSPLSNIGPDDQGADSLLGGNSYHLVVRNSPESQYKCQFEFGPYESEKGTFQSAWHLFLRHSGEAGPAYINAWLNPSDAVANWGILDWNGVYPGLPVHVWGVGDSNYWAGALPRDAGVGSAFIYNTFDITDKNLFTGMGVPNIFQIMLDEAAYSRSNYWMGGCAVMPMDVRIEAIMYAQEGSFFVIPGPWLNPDTADTDPTNRPPGVDSHFPLYKEAPDIRIIIDGAVSENMPAAIGDVEEWMAKWGRIPETYGSSGVATAHPGARVNGQHIPEGITFLYDDHVGWPLDDAGNPVRVDAYGRALPLTPKLPVSGSLIYFGDVM